MTSTKTDMDRPVRALCRPIGTLAFVLTALSVLPAPALAAGSAGQGRLGSIAIGVRDLPSGAKGRVSLTGPGRSSSLRRSKAVHRLRAGEYRIDARPVTAGPNTYYAVIAPCPDPVRCGTLAGGRVSLKPGHRLKLFVLYENVIPRTTRVLRRSQVARLRDGIAPDGTLVFGGRAPLPFSRGSVIVAPPSANLPNGLLREVLRLRKSPRRQVVTTAPATLADAIPRGFLDLEIGASAPASGGARISSSASWSLGHRDFPFSCGRGRSADFSSDATASSDFRFTAGWDRGLAPHIAIAGTLSAEISADLRAESGASCGWTRDVPSSPSPGVVLPRRVMFIGPVPIWITPELVGTYGASAAVTGLTSFGLTEQFKVTGGLSYANGHLDHDFDAFHQTLRPVGAPTTAAKAELWFAPKLYVDFFSLRLAACEVGDCEGAPTTYLAFGPAATLRVNSDGPPSTTNEPWWRLDGSLKGSLGIHFGLFGFRADQSRDFDLLKYPLVAPPGRPRNLSAEPGDESATVSWRPPPVNPGPPDEPCACKEVSGYTVYVDGEERAEVGPNLTSLTLDRLTNGVTYRISVRANSTAGPPLDSGQTEPVAVTPEKKETHPQCVQGPGSEGEETLRSTGGQASTQVAALPAWSAPVDVSGQSEIGGEQQIAMNGSGDAIVVWHGNGLAGASRVAGGPWSQLRLAFPWTGDGYEPQVAIDHAGDWAAVWTYGALFDEESYAGIRAIRCIGGALTGPVTVAAPHFDTDAYNALDRFEPSVAIDGQGGSTAVWHTFSKALGGERAGVSAVEASSGPPAGPWSAPTTLTDPTEWLTTFERPAVAADGAGNAIAVWPAFFSDEAQAFCGPIRGASKPSGSAWSAAVTVAQQVAKCDQPPGTAFDQSRLSMNEAGYAVAVWSGTSESGTARQIFASQRPPGGNWGAMVDISASAEGSLRPVVAVNADGDATVVWRQGCCKIGTAGKEGGASWQAPVTLAGTSPTVAPEVAMNDAGDAVVVWRAGQYVQAEYRVAGGVWGPVETLSQSAETKGNVPQVGMDDRGSAVAVWESDGGRIQVAELTR